MQNDKVFYIHARPMAFGQYAPKTGATFAVRRTKMGLYKMAVALCGKKDHYNRAVGRQIAGARLEKLPFYRSVRLGTVINNMFETCRKHGFVLPVNSVLYLQDRAPSNGRREKSRL